MNFPTEKWSANKIINFTREALDSHVRQAWHIGRALLILRKKVKHGDWMDYMAETFPRVHHSTLWRYMQVANAHDNPDDVKSLVPTPKKPRVKAVVENPGEVQQGAAQITVGADETPPENEWQDKIDSLEELAALCGAAAAALERLSHQDAEAVRAAWGKHPSTALDIVDGLRDQAEAFRAWAMEDEAAPALAG